MLISCKLFDIDRWFKWTGADTHVVQVGDQVDRCRYSGVPCNQKGATDPDEGKLIGIESPA